MEKININVNLKNQEMNYNYKGLAYINKDIIDFYDKEYNKDYHYIFDKSVKRLIKSSETTTLIFDFNNKELRIIENNKELRTSINVKKVDIKGNNIEIIYIIDKNEILFEIKEVD